MHIRVLIPSYNRNAEIVLGLQSLLAQSHSDWSAVVVDNASDTPLTEYLSRCQPFLLEDTRISVVRYEKLLPIIQNWNRLLDHAENCDYIKFLWSDDYLHEDCLAEMLLSNADVISTGHQRVNQDLKVTGTRSYKKFFGNIFMNCLLKNYFGCPSSVLIRKSALKDIRFNIRNQYCADLQFLLDLKCINNCSSEYLTRQDLVKVLVHSETETGRLKFTPRMIRNKFQLSLRLLKYW